MKVKGQKKSLVISAVARIGLIFLVAGRNASQGTPAAAELLLTA